MGDGQQLTWRRQRSQRKAVAADLGGMGGGKSTGGKSSGKGQPGSKGGGNQRRYKEGAGAQAGTYYSTSNGPWVPCTNKQCKGHNGGASFKWVSSIGVGVNGMACMGCGQPWEDSLADALAAGAIPDFVAEEEAAASPFGPANLAPSGNGWTSQTASPFTTPSFAALPKDIQLLVDERLRAYFLLALDPGKSEQDKKKVLDFVEDYSAKGNIAAAQFLEALAKAKPLVAPPKPVLLAGGDVDPNAGSIQQKVTAGRKKRNELDADKKKKQRAVDRLQKGRPPPAA